MERSEIGHQIVRSGVPESAIYDERFVSHVMAVRGDPGDRLKTWLMSGGVFFRLVRTAAYMLETSPEWIMHVAGHEDFILGQTPTERIIEDVGLAIEFYMEENEGGRQ